MKRKALYRFALNMLVLGWYVLSAQAQIVDTFDGYLEAMGEVQYTDDVLANVTPVSEDIQAHVDRLNADLINKSEVRKAQALKEVVYIANQHGQGIDFRRTASRLYEVYRYDRNESYRVMALAALHAIGRKNSMKLLYQHVPFERSPRVRRQTVAALADYYGQN